MTWAPLMTLLRAPLFLDPLLVRGTELNSSITSTNENVLSRVSPIPKRLQLTSEKIGNIRKTTVAVLTDWWEKRSFFLPYDDNVLRKDNLFLQLKGYLVS